MPTSIPIVVLGQYNSGSTVVAGILHRLGVDMGGPFWRCSDDHSPENFYEPWDLSSHLRYWWDEPYLRETVDKPTRIALLTHWLRQRQRLYPGPVGVKHPLLALETDTILQAWGAAVLFLRARRPLDESLDRLRARQWFAGHEEPLQRKLWQALEAFGSRQPHLSVSSHRLRAEPAAVIAEIAAYAHLTLTSAQHAAAVAFIRPDH